MTLLLAAAVLAAAYFVLTAGRYVLHNYQLRQDEAQIRRDIAQLDSDHEQLVAVRDYLKSDEYIEYTARGILGLVRPGETLVIVSSSGTAPPAATPQPDPQRTPAAASEWWKDLFGPPAGLAPTPTP